MTTWNPIDKHSSVDLSNSNLTATGNSASYSASARSTESKTTGKWYFEVAVDQLITYIMIGGESGSYDISTAPGGDGVGGFGYKFTGNFYLGGSFQTVASYTAGDVIGVAVDCDNKTADFYKNNTHQGSQITSSVFTTTPLFAAVAVGQNDSATARFAAASQTYSPPEGYSAWDASETTTVHVDTKRQLKSVITASVDTRRKMSGPISVNIDTSRKTKQAQTANIDTRRRIKTVASANIDTKRRLKLLASVTVDTSRRRSIPFGYQQRGTRNIVVTVDTERRLD